jgi:hypothetical protein
MVAIRPASRGPRVGVALTPTTLCAAVARPGDSRARAWRASIAPLNGDGTGWVALTDALRALARETGGTGRLCIALMPPLAEARGVELPPVGEREAQQLLSRGASRYFTAARGPQVVGTVRTRGNAGGRTVVAAAASARLLSAIHDAAQSAGWEIDSIVPAEAAWAAAGAAWGRKGATTQVLVAHGDRTDLLRVVGASLTDVRRFRAGAAEAGLIADAAASASGTVTAVGSASARRELAQALAARGVTVESPPVTATELADEPDFLAATFATGDAEPRLVTEAERTARGMWIRQLTVRLAIGAAVVALAAGVLELWGVKRELRAVQAERATLRPQLATTLVGRTTVETAYQQLTVLSRAQRTAPEWSAVIAGVSERLPLESYLTGFRGNGDSVVVDGLASRATRVFDALERVKELAEVRATAPVRLETPSDGPPMERFTISARVVRETDKPPAVAAMRGGARR